ncbi:hypothetical protein [Arenicella xantha]|uniref:TolA protein n=1 Tax=Arenicella xantha TaxID=644221 RepID=A0A395JG52_9GAMM|nr:hypothetical protein [Arenicella xantha]RBP48425.1 hypothetical protein DFR28_10727 [Arenicella xantha]
MIQMNIKQSKQASGRPTITKQSAALSLMILAALGLSPVSHAKVKSQTADEFAQYGPEDAYWVFTVTCADDSERKVQRKTDGEQWCAKDVDGFCDTDRVIAAEKSCSEEYLAAAGQASTKAKPAAPKPSADQQRAAAEKEREAKRRQQQERERAAQAAKEKADAEAKREQEAKDQISIQEELLKIEQEKLNLRRQELELQQRAVEIEELLEKSEE